MKTQQKLNFPLLTDGGLETTFVFQHGIELPHFASFTLLDNPLHRRLMMDYYREYMELAARFGTGFILECPTWRANANWGYKLGYDAADLKRINRQAIAQMQLLQQEYAGRIDQILVSGCVGPAADGYTPGELMSVEQATTYHHPQLRTFSEAGVEIATAMTINYLNEGCGIALAAKSAGVPIVISFTVETDGLLPDGTPLADAIEQTDLQSDAYPLYYMINCAHPTHFQHLLHQDGEWKNRLVGIRSNASCKSHAELDECDHLDRGDVAGLATWYSKINELLPNLGVVGGCCGTDAEHLAEICELLLPEATEKVPDNVNNPQIKL